MPDERNNAPWTDGHWPATDESSGNDPWPSAPEPPAASDSWASDLWAPASSASSDIWSPPAEPSAAGPAGAPSAPDRWGSSTDALTDTWMTDLDAPAAEPSSEGAWVSDVWASTEPSPWVSDLWASTDPSSASSADAWPDVNEGTAGAESPEPTLDVPPTDASPLSDPAVSVSEPFWRSESWLLEPLADDTGPVKVTGDVDGGSEAGWSDDSGADSPPAGPGTTSPATDESTDPTDARLAESSAGPVSWSDLGEDSDGAWSSYQRQLDSPQDAPARPSARAAAPAAPPTNASDFASQRGAGPPDPPTKGFPRFMYKLSAGLVRMSPTKDEQVRRDAIKDIRRSIAGLRQITFTNPKGGSGKTTAALLTSMTLGQLRGGYVLAWDNNETQGTLGVRAQRNDHANTVRDLIADLPAFSGPVAGRVGDLAKYVRSQGDAMFDILASDEQAEAGEMMTAAAFQAVREVVGRFFKIICVDTGNNVRAANWAASIDSTDQLVVTASVRWESAYSASRMLDYLEQSGRGDLVSNAVTVLTMPASMKGLNISQVETHFALRTREVLRVPFDEQLDNGDEIRFTKLTPATRLAWLKISAAIVRGL